MQQTRDIISFLNYLGCENAVVQCRNFKIQDEEFKKQRNNELYYIKKLEQTLEYNSPDVMAWWVFFTINCVPPASRKKIWDNVSQLWGEVQYKKNPIVNALVIDIDDHSGKSSKEQLREYLAESCSWLSRKPLITETNTWFHLIFPINPDDKKILADKNNLAARDLIYRWLCHTFDPRFEDKWFTLIDSAHTKVYRRERLPYTFWEISTWVDKNWVSTYTYCRLLAPNFEKTFDEVENLDRSKIDEYKITRITESDCSILSNNYQNYKNQSTEINKVQSKFTNNHKQAFADVKIIDVIDRLASKRATQNLCRKIKVVDWKSIAVVVKLENWDEVIKKTDWWKVCTKENYVNNFSPYDKVFRPVWWVYSFVYLMFGKSHSLAVKFFYKEYDINLQDIIWWWDQVEWETFVQRIAYQDAVITVNYLGTMMTNIVQTKNGWTVPKITKLCNKPIIIKAKWSSTRYMTSFGLIAESSQPTMWYIVDLEWKEFMMTRQVNTNKFNELYSVYWMHFLSDNVALGTYFDALEHSDIPDVEIISKSRLTTDYVSMEWHFIRYHDDTKNTTWDAPQWVYFCPNPEINIHDLSFAWLIGKSEVEPCTLQSYRDHINKCYRPLYWHLPFLFGVLAWSMDYLDDVIKWESWIKPGCMFSWERWTGKSQLAQVIRLMCWMNPQSTGTSGRFLDLQSTLQPVKQMLADPALCVLDEPDEKTDIDAVIKSAINMNTSKRWSVNGNIEFKFKAWILITGNRKMSDASVNSRLFLFTFPSAYAPEHAKAHYWRKDIYEWLLTHSPAFQIWKFWINHRDDVLKYRQAKSELLRWLVNIEDRVIDSYALLLSIAQVLSDNDYIVDIDEKDLVRHIHIHTKLSMQQISSSKAHSYIQLRACLMDLNNKKKLSLLHTPKIEWLTNHDEYCFVITDQRAFDQQWHIINQHVQTLCSMNDELYDCIEMNWQQITVKIGTNKALDEVLFTQIIGAFYRKKVKTLHSSEDIFCE